MIADCVPIAQQLGIVESARAHEAWPIVAAMAEAAERAGDDDLVAEARPAAPADIFRREGSIWFLAFEGRKTQLPDAKGLHDIATLLRAPGCEVHVLTLLGIRTPPTGADAVLDQPARAHYTARLAELDAEVVAADIAVDPGRSERANAEREALVRELTAATGLGGRKRRLGDETERARNTVGARIRDVLARVERVHPALASHLRATLRTWMTCIYAPLGGRHWQL